MAQTRELPMTGLDAVKDHAAAVRTLVSWDRVGVLMDEGPQAVVTVLLDGDTVVSASRFCLSAAKVWMLCGHTTKAWQPRWSCGAGKVAR